MTTALDCLPGRLFPPRRESRTAAGARREDGPQSLGRERPHGRLWWQLTIPETWSTKSTQGIGQALASSETRQLGGGGLAAGFQDSLPVWQERRASGE